MNLKNCQNLSFLLNHFEYRYFSVFASKIYPYISSVLEIIFHFCKNIINNKFVADCVFNYEGAISIGGAIKILRMTCGFCIEKFIFSQIYLRLYTKSARHLENFYSTPYKSSLLKIKHTTLKKCIIRFLFYRIKICLEEREIYTVVCKFIRPLSFCVIIFFSNDDIILKFQLNMYCSITNRPENLF